MPAKPLICVVTSEKTWPTLARLGFNQSFRAQREAFELAVAFNGSSDEGLAVVAQLEPDLVCVRANTGYECAGFDELLRRVQGDYPYFALLHDDHWFETTDWLPILLRELAARPEVDGIGNLVEAAAYLPHDYRAIAGVLGFAGDEPERLPYFLQGMAGLFRGHVLDTLRQLDGIPHIHRNDKQVAQVCERLFTFQLLDAGLRFEQIPPGYEEFLRHGET